MEIAAVGVHKFKSLQVLFGNDFGGREHGVDVLINFWAEGKWVVKYCDPVISGVLQLCLFKRLAQCKVWVLCRYEMKSSIVVVEAFKHGIFHVTGP